MPDRIDLQSVAEASPTSEAEGAPRDHVRAAWRTWLSALATDAEAAMGAALTYESLPAEGRDAWLDALATELPTLGVPRVAVYAPLLGVETDERRLARMGAALGRGEASAGYSVQAAQAVRGLAPDGTHVCIVVCPVYLDYVQVLTCRYATGGGFLWATCDPLVHAADVVLGSEVDGIPLEPASLRLVVDELAHAVLSDRRQNRPSPPALARFAALFTP